MILISKSFSRTDPEQSRGISGVYSPHLDAIMEIQFHEITFQLFCEVVHCNFTSQIRNLKTNLS